MYQRTLGAASTSVVVLPFDRAHYAQLIDSQGRPPHAIAGDGSWVSLVHGVNADGSFQSGRDPLTGEYWPGDAWIGLRPVYYVDLGPVPFMDPDGFNDTRAAFEHGFGGEPGTGTVYVAPPTPGTPQTVTLQPPPLDAPTPAQMTPAQQAAHASNPSLPIVTNATSNSGAVVSLGSSSFELSPKLVIAALVALALFTRR